MKEAVDQIRGKRGPARVGVGEGENKKSSTTAALPGPSVPEEPRGGTHESELGGKEDLVRKITPK